MVNSRFALPVLMLVVLLASMAALSQKPDKNPRKNYAVISGTVFREPGFALGGAEIDLQPMPEPGASKKLKVKAIQRRTDSRGEFAFRVPDAEMSYTVRIRASGYLEEKKTVMIHGAERQDIFVTLKTASREGSQ